MTETKKLTKEEFWEKIEEYFDEYRSSKESKNGKQRRFGVPQLLVYLSDIYDELKKKIC